MPEHYEKLLSHTLKPWQVKLCPTLDIFAVVNDEDQLEVFRFNGQRAFVYKRPGSNTISSLKWMSNGAAISVIWSDGAIDIVDSGLGRLMQRIDPRESTESGEPLSEAEASKTKIASHGWGLNLIDPSAVPKAVSREQHFLHKNHIADEADADADDIEEWIDQDKSTRQPTRDDFTQRIPDPDLVNFSADLPRQLALLDVESELPRLSPLPHVDEKLALDFSADAFTTQAGVDTAMHQKSDNDAYSNMVDLMLAYWEDGVMTVHSKGLICQLPESLLDLDRKAVAIAQASHPLSSCHALLARRINSPQLALSLLSFNALRESGHFFNLVAAKTESLVNISRYIMQTLAAMRFTWKTSQSVGRRFVDNVGEDLRGLGMLDIDAALYHQAVTGDSLAPVKEWLIDQLQERGHKRWDGAVGPGYQAIVELTHTHLLPALERATVVVSRLRGLSQTPSLPLFDLHDRYFTRIMADIENLRLVGHHILQYAAAELRAFRVFSAWLLTQIALHRAEPGSTAANEAAEKAAAIDMGTILYYIQGPMTKSHLNFFLSRESRDIVEAARRPGQHVPRTVMLQILERHKKKCVQPQGEGTPVETVNALFLGLFLRDSIAEVAEVPVKGFARATTSTEPVILEAREELCELMDLRMVVDMSRCQQDMTDSACTYAAGVSKKHQNQVRLYRAMHSRFHDKTRGTSSAPVNVAGVVSSAVSDRTAAKVVAVQFIDDNTLAVLTTRPLSSGSKKSIVELHTGQYGGRAMKRDASTGKESWTTDFKVVRTWGSEKEKGLGDDGWRGFMPAMQGMEIRRSIKGKGVVVCLVDDKGERIRVEEVVL